MSRRKTALLFCFLFLVSSLRFPVRTDEQQSSNAKRELESVAAALVINEYLADPPDGAAGDANGDGTRDSAQDEFIEMVNAASTPLDLSGFTLRDGTQVRFTFPQGKIAPPGESVVVFGGGNPQGDFGNASANGLVFKASASAGLSLNNTGDTITIKDAGGSTVASITYTSVEGNANQSVTRSPDVTGSFVAHSSAAGSNGRLFSPGARVNGRPFSTADPIAVSVSPDSAIAGTGTVTVTVTGQNFQSGSRVRVDGLPVATGFISATELSAEVSSPATDSPGAHALAVENPDGALSNAITFTVFGAVGINEFLADPPDGAAGDANGDDVRDSSQDEFVEVVNRTGEPVNVGGFTIRDADSLRFSFPPATILPAGEAAVVFGGGSPRGEFGNAQTNGLVFTAALSLNNTGDTIKLTDGNGGVIESVTFTSAEGNANQSVTRNPEIVGTRFAPHSTVAGSGARLFSPGARANGAAFTVGPRIDHLTPDRALFAAPPFPVAVVGSGFEADSIVFIDSKPAATTFISPSELQAMVSDGVTSAAGTHALEVRSQGGNRSNVVGLLIIPPPPAIDFVLPGRVTVGGAAFTVFIQGQFFDSSSVVLIDEAPLMTRFINSREVRATVPAPLTATVGTRRVRVRRGDGQVSNEATLEVVHPGAQIKTITPTEVVAGGQAFTLVVAGLNFRSGLVVLFDRAELETKFISQTELRAEVPPSFITTVGLHSIAIAGGGGELSNEAIFRVLPVAPIIRSIDPSSAVEGSTDVRVTFTGEKFQSGAVARLVEATRLGPALETSFITSERLEATLPAAFLQAPGSISLRVDNPDFGTSNNVVFKVFIKNPLVINEYLADPPEGAAGDANGDGARNSSQDEFVEIVNRTAEAMDISGYRLADGESVRHVFAAGTVLPPFEAAVVFGGGAPTGRFGNASDNKLVFKASSGGLSLNNTGDTVKLEDATGRVVDETKFGAAEGAANQSMNRDPDTNGAAFALHGKVALDAARLFSPGARADGQPFTIKPAIIALTPASVRRAAPDFTLMISGAGFLPGAVALFDEAELATAYRSETLLEARVSAELVDEGGTASLRVRNPKGGLSAPVKFLIVDDPPRITAISPRQTGTGAEGLEVTVAGERFERGAIVTVTGKPAETRFVNASSLLAILPAKFFERAAQLELRVTNADGNLSNAATLKVENGPLITRLSRSEIKAGQGAVEMTIGGVAFEPGVTLFVDDAAVESHFRSETEFIAVIPAEMTAEPGSLTLQARNPDGGRSNRVTIKVVIK